MLTVGNKIEQTLGKVKAYWKMPPPGRYMTFKEIASYAGGGIGAYFIITLGMNLIVNTTNAIVGNVIGVSPTDMYVLYIISTLANIPLTAVRSTMIDNSRNKAGKYRPFLISMGVPTAIISILYVWFPYDKLYDIFPSPIFGKAGGYVAMCAVILVFNLLLQFFYNFFNDAYTNLVHVLSPDTQERTDVLSIKAVVYSLAPSIYSLIMPIIAQLVADNNLYDIRVYRYSYPVFAIIGMALTVIVFANTKEKIVQAKTHIIQVSFIDSFKAVARNKYFWIIALAGWLGFLEGVYGTALDWLFSYGHACEGGTLGIIRTVVSNASLWGMIIAPFCIKAIGKKKTLVGVNTMNIVCILAMLINIKSIWWVAICIYMNWLFTAFEHITTPAIQADIRDYHQYKTGERVDGMFATVQTIGNIVTLFTSGVLPFVYKSYGIHENNGYKNPYDILDINTGEPGLLYKILTALVLMGAIGAALNLIPYFFYDLTERKQRSIVRVLKIRAMFEDHNNGITNNRGLVEGIDTINHAKQTAALEPKAVDRSYRSIKDKEERKAAKKAHKEAVEFNEEIEISKLVCQELDKFSAPLYQSQLKASRALVSGGLAALYYLDADEINAELAKARKLPKATEAEREYRHFAIEIAHGKKEAIKAIKKYYPTPESFVQPDFAALEGCFAEEDECDEKLRKLYLQKHAETEADAKRELIIRIRRTQQEKKAAQANAKAEMDKHARFNRAAKPYLNAVKLIAQAESYSNLDEIFALYDHAKAQAEEADRAAVDEQAKQKLAEKEQLEALKAAKKKKK